MAPRNGPSVVKFNVQDYLRDMEIRAAERHDALVKKVENGFCRAEKRLDEHEHQDLEHDKVCEAISDRLQPVEDMQTTFKWTLRTAIVAMIGGVADLVINHLAPALRR